MAEMDSKPAKFFGSFSSALAALGGLACIFVWLGIKPGDLRMTPTWPHIAWLFTGLILFAVSIGMSVYSGFRSARGLRRIKKDQEVEIKRIETSSASEVWRANEIRNQYKDERNEALDKVLILQKEIQAQAATTTVGGLFVPVQIEAFRLAKELRDFFASLEPFPDDPIQTPGEDTAAFLVRSITARGEIQGKWKMKLVHGYANREFGKRITSLMHRAGEEFDYPAYVPSYAETIAPTKEVIPKLAQQMEMVAIWINRKQRNEVHLLG